MSDTAWLGAAGAAMWVLVQRYTGRIGHKRGSKAAAIALDPPTIDCSGWTALLLASGMKAANRQGASFNDADIAAVNAYSERIIEVLERRSGAGGGAR